MQGAQSCKLPRWGLATVLRPWPWAHRGAGKTAVLGSYTGVWLRHGAGSRFRSCGAARCTAGEVPQIGPSLLSNLKRCFPPLTCARIPGLGAPGTWDGFCARAASSRYITGSEVRPVQCLHTATSRACLRVGRPARLDLLVAAGWNQAPAGPAREWSMQAVIGPSCASQPPDGIQWLVRTAGGSPKILGEGSGLGAPAPLAAQAAASGAHRRQRRTAPLSSPR